MSDVSTPSGFSQAKEAATKRQTFELRKIESENEREIKDVQAKSEKKLKMVEKDFEVKIRSREQ